MLDLISVLETISRFSFEKNSRRKNSISLATPPRRTRKIVYFGFFIGISFTLLFSTNFADLISIRIAIGSAFAFVVAQLLDVQIFDYLRKRKWFVAPLTSSLIGSTVDTFLFFSIAFYATGIPWVTLSLGDLAVKICVALIMLIPFRLLLGSLKAVKA